MQTLLELLRFLFKRKKLWMAPIILVILLIGLVLIFAQIPVVGPFIYTLF